MEIAVQLPKNWYSINESQLEIISRAFCKFKSKEEMLTMIFLKFAGWKLIRWMYRTDGENSYIFFKRGKERFYVETGEIVSAISELHWILKEYSPTNHVPEIGYGKKPDLLLYEIDVEKFLIVENFYGRFTKSGDFKDLLRVVALLYGNDANSINLKKEVRRLKWKPAYKIFSVFIWYSGIKTWLRNKYPYVFVGSSGDESEEPDRIILNLMSSLNGGDVTKNQSILKTKMHEAFHELNLKIEQSKTK